MLRWIFLFVLLTASVAAAVYVAVAPEQIVDDWHSYIVPGAIAVAVFIVSWFLIGFQWTVTLLLLTGVVVGAGFLAREPGSIVLDWRGYHLEVSVAVAILGLLLLIAAVVLIFHFLWITLRTPKDIARSVDGRQQKRGYEAVSRGLVAVAAGDAESARRHARKAETLLAKRPLTMLLSAQSAQLDGDEQAAKSFFESMQGQWDTEFLGVRGLLTQAIKREDWADALSLAKRAYSLNPKSAWVVETLYELQKRTQQWSNAKATLEEAKRQKVLPDDVIKAEMAEVLYRKCLTASPDNAIQEAKDAYKADPTFIPAAVRFASLMAGAGLSKKAARVVEDVWAENPDRQLADVYFASTDWQDAKTKLDVAKRLARSNPNHVESRLIVGECAMEAKLWDEARANIEPFADENASTRVCRLMAQLEEEVGNSEGALVWLMRASGSRDLQANLSGSPANLAKTVNASESQPASPTRDTEPDDPAKPEEAIANDLPPTDSELPKSKIDQASTVEGRAN